MRSFLQVCDYYAPVLQRSQKCVEEPRHTGRTVWSMLVQTVQAVLKKERHE